MRSAWTPQPIYCNACGKKYETNFWVEYPDGKHVCSKECFAEMERRYYLSMFGEKYKPLYPFETEPVK